MFDPISLAVSIGLMLVSSTLAARAARRSAKDVQFPSIDPNRPIPYVAGTVKLSPQVVWWGDFKRSKVTLPNLWFIGGIVAWLVAQLPLAYRYYLGINYVLCHGASNAIFGHAFSVEGVYINDKLLWSGSVTTGQINLSKPGYFGIEGGVHAKLDVAPGQDTQSANSYLASFLGDYPAHRYYATVTWRGPSSGDVGFSTLGEDIKWGGYVGRTVVIKPIAFRVKMIPLNLYPLYHTINSVDANPAHVLWDLMTSESYGMGLASTSIDQDAFIVAAETLYNEGLGTSFKWEDSSSVEEIVQQQIDLIDCAIYTDLETGKITITLIRDDYDVDTIPEVTITNASDVVSFTTRTPDDVPNDIRVSFTDVNNNFLQGTAIFQSLGNRFIQGSRTPLEISYPVSDAALAAKLATRDGMSTVLPLHDVVLKGNRELAGLMPGDVFKLVWPEYDIAQMILRVTKPNLGSLDDPEVTLECVEDRFALGDAAYGTATVTWTNPVPTGVSGQLSLVVINMTTTTPPGSPTVGDAYVVAVGGTGAWAGHDGEITRWDGTQWEFSPSSELENAVVFDDDTQTYYQNDGTGTWTALPLGTRQHGLVFDFDGAGSAITTSIDPACIPRIPWNCKILSWTVNEVTGTAGTITIDLRTDTYANYPPTGADSITGTGAKPGIASSGVKDTGTDFTNWLAVPPTLTKDSTLYAVVTAAATVKHCVLELQVEEV